MINSNQEELFDSTISAAFDAWRQTPGGKHLLKHAYRIAAGLLRRTPPGQRLSVKLVWELLRHRLRWIKAGLRRRGIVVQTVDGFALNNVFTAYVARHLMAHRPEWAGRFEVRELAAKRRKRKVLVIEERVAA